MTPPVACSAAEKERVAVVSESSWSCLVQHLLCFAQILCSSGPKAFSGAILWCIQTSERRLACVCHPTLAMLLCRSLLWCAQCSLACCWIMCCDRRFLWSGNHSVTPGASCARARLSPGNYPWSSLCHGDLGFSTCWNGRRLLLGSVPNIVPVVATEREPRKG